MSVVAPDLAVPSAGEPPATIESLLVRYRDGSLRPTEVVRDVATAIAAADPAVFIDRIDGEMLQRRAGELEALPDGPTRLPLYGVPFAVKDNIDVRGRPTTAACPDFASTAERSASAVRVLERAGAILVGKTNLDQFATGLVGTRSPYGVPTNPHAPDHIPGGSSSGSAVAVASGLVPFALGTDTAGSGRVPAAMTGTVGLKPTRGLVSTTGVVPACRSLDCVSVFTTTAADAALVLAVLDEYDPEDGHARQPGERQLRPADDLHCLRVGIPGLTSVDPALADAFSRHVGRLRELGLTPVPIDLAPFSRAGELLYEGPWLAERLAGVGRFVTERPESVLPVTRQVLEGGRRFSAVEVFEASDELASLRRAADAVFAEVDLLALPSVPTLLTLDEVATDPIASNARLGQFTNFVNLLDLAAVAVPSGAVDGVPVGITLLGPALTDATLLDVAAATQAGSVVADRAPSATVGTVRLAVVGAHLRGQPLHHQLVTGGARLVERTTTAPSYRLYALEGQRLAKPGLVADERGESIEVEVYELSAPYLEVLRAATSAPLSIGPVVLADGTTVEGFRCDPEAVSAATDITGFGGWRAYLASSSPRAATPSPHRP